MRLVLRRLLAAALAAVFLSAAPVADAGPTPLARKLSKALSVPHVAKSRTGALAVDLVTGRPVYAHNLGLPLDTRFEREARGHVRLPAGARAELPLRDRRARRGRAGRIAVARGHRPQGLRRPDAVDARPAQARLAAPLAGHPARQRADRGRRVVLRRQADGAGLEALVLHQRVGAALGLDRRPGPLQGPNHARARARRRAVVPSGTRFGPGSPWPVGR